MKKIFAFLISALVINACTDPFDDTSIWDKLNEHEKKINDIENDVNGSDDTNNNTGIPGEAVSNKIYYTTADGKKLFPANTEPAVFGAILVSNIYENGIGILTFDDDIISIRNSAFSYCYGLTSITIPNRVTSIGNEAFNLCSGLKEVHINDLSAWCNISFGGYYANPLSYAENLYLNGELVTDLVIPDNVKEIKDYAFYSCSRLTSVTIPNSVTSIGNNAFRDCDGLTSIEIPNSVTSIGNFAFRDCTGLKEVHINDLDAWNNISFDDYYANPLNNSNAKLYLNGVEVK